MSPLARILRSLRERGLRATILSARRHAVTRASRFADRPFDTGFGTETSQVVENCDLRDVRSANLARGIRYEPTRARPFKRILRAAAIPARGTFVDIGCGKGRVLMLAALHGFNRVVGVDYSPSLCGTAERNLASLRSTKQLRFDAVIHALDAADYEFQPDETVVFLFNPFDEVVLRRVLDNLRTSLQRHPRALWLIYHHPLWRSAVEECGLFSTAEEHSFGGCDFAVFRTG